MRNNERIIWIDVAKGITIILVIIGHTISGIGRGLIFSFHLPLFFILSLITYKTSNNSEQLVKNVSKGFKHLIIPAYMMFMCSTLILLRNVNCRDISSIRDYFRNVILTASFASGVEVPVNGTVIWCFGIPWFLVVLFIGRIIYDYFQMKYSPSKLMGLCIVFALMGWLIGNIQWLPFSIDIAFFILPFLWIGDHFEKFNIEQKKMV